MALNNIITRIRDTLSDANATRWSDDRLIRLIDEAQKTICRRAKVLRYHVNIVANPDQSTYTLPSDSQIVSRVLYNGKPLKIVSHEQMDDLDSDWNTAKGTPEYAITNKLERGLLKLSPIPNFVENDPFDIAKANLIGLYYIRVPDTITAITDTLDLEEQYETMIRFYVTGQALRDDQDTQNRQFGLEQLQLFDSELQRVMEEVEKDFTNANTMFETKYWTGL